MKKQISLLLCLLLMLGFGSVAVAKESDPTGVVEGATYTNAFFGIQIELPDSWRFLSDE